MIDRAEILAAFDALARSDAGFQGLLPGIRAEERRLREEVSRLQEQLGQLTAMKVALFGSILGPPDRRKAFPPSINTNELLPARSCASQRRGPGRVVRAPSPAPQEVSMRDPWLDNRTVTLLLMIAFAWVTHENVRLAAALSQMAALAVISGRTAETPDDGHGATTIDPGSLSDGGMPSETPLQAEPGQWL